MLQNFSFNFLSENNKEYNNLLLFEIKLCFTTKTWLVLELKAEMAKGVYT